MKLPALICAVILCLGLASCSDNPAAPTTVPTTTVTTVPTTAPSDPGMKTIYVHTSITSSSDTMDATTEYVYDDNGYLTEVIQYSGTTQTQRYTVVCDENGNFTQWNTTVGSLILSIHYAYDEEGNKLGSAQYHNGELMTQTVYTIENGLRTEIITIMPAQNQETRTRYTYNSQGVRVREDYLVNNVLQRYGVYTTDSQGRVAFVNFYLADGTLHSTVAYTYDGSTETQTLQDPAGNILQKDVITRDENGNIHTTHRYNGEGVLTATKTETWQALTIPVDCPRKTDSALA